MDMGLCCRLGLGASVEPVCRAQSCVLRLGFPLGTGNAEGEEGSDAACLNSLALQEKPPG